VVDRAAGEDDGMVVTARLAPAALARFESLRPRALIAAAAM
jgi:hypothetical protein